MVKVQWFCEKDRDIKSKKSTKSFTKPYGLEAHCFGMKEFSQRSNSLHRLKITADSHHRGLLLSNVTVIRYGIVLRNCNYSIQLINTMEHIQKTSFMF